MIFKDLLITFAGIADGVESVLGSYAVYLVKISYGYYKLSYITHVLFLRQAFSLY